MLQQYCNGVQQYFSNMLQDLLHLRDHFFDCGLLPASTLPMYGFRVSSARLCLRWALPPWTTTAQTEGENERITFLCHSRVMGGLPNLWRILEAFCTTYTFPHAPQFRNFVVRASSTSAPNIFPDQMQNRWPKNWSHIFITQEFWLIDLFFSTFKRKQTKKKQQQSW